MQTFLLCKPKFSFRHLMQGIQEFHRKYVLIPADKAANNVVIVRHCLLYINTSNKRNLAELLYTHRLSKMRSVIDRHSSQSVKFVVKIKEIQAKLPTLYWLPKLRKRPYKACIITNSSSCTKIELSNLFLSYCYLKIKYNEIVYDRSGKNLFCFVKSSTVFLNKLKSRPFRASSLSTYDFPSFIQHCRIN